MSLFSSLFLLLFFFSSCQGSDLKSGNASSPSDSADEAASDEEEGEPATEETGEAATTETETSGGETAAVSEESGEAATTETETSGEAEEEAEETAPSVGLLSNRLGDVDASAEHLAQFSFVILRDDQGVEWVPKIRAANPDAKILVYKNVAATRTDSCTGGVENDYLSVGVSHCWVETNHSDWFALDTDGNRIEFSDYPGLYQMRVDIGEYQNTWFDNVLAALKERGYDGVFMDDVNTNNWHWTGKTAQAWTTDSEIEDAFLSFISNVGPRFTDAGYLAIPNLGVGWTSRFADIYEKFSAYASGAMDEATSSWCGTGATFGGQWWEWARLAHEKVTSLGKIMLAVDCTAAMTDKDQMRYARASWLMGVSASNPGALMYQPLAAKTDVWDDEWTIDIGAPAGSRVETDGGWRRDFTKGVAVVNPSETLSITIDLGGTFTMSDGSAVTSVTLGPKSGLVLEKQEGR